MISMMSAKMAALDILKNNGILKKSYDVRIPVDDVINKILSRDSNHIVDVPMLPEFGNSIISMRELITTSILYGFDQKNVLFGGVVLLQGCTFCTSVEKGLKLKVRKFWGLIPTFVEVTREKLVEGPS